MLLAAAATAMQISAEPLKVALYAGSGAQGAGEVHWLHLTARAEDCGTLLVDSAAIMGGALDDRDVLIVPGGESRLMAKALGESGRGKVRDFVFRGGGYIGICAGCCLAMESSKFHPDMMNMIPFAFGSAGGKGKARLTVHFNKRAAALCGIQERDRDVWFSEGPELVPLTSAHGSAMETIATYGGDAVLDGTGVSPEIRGGIAVVAGTCGKGRVFASAIHPEHDAANHDILRGAFRYVTGREVAWTIAPRGTVRMAVGIMCDDGFSIDTARFVQQLAKDPEFQIEPIKASSVAKGALQRLDAVVTPESDGGLALGWGQVAAAARKAEPRTERFDNGAAVLARLKAYAQRAE